MTKVTVKVCKGTTCFVMGGNNLQDLNNIIPVRYANKVDLVGSSCLGLCLEGENFSKAPFVKIDDDVIEEATIDKVLSAIDQKLGE